MFVFYNVCSIYATPLCIIAIMGEPRSSGKKWSQAQVNSESRKHLAESKRYIVSDLRVKCISESITEKKQFARVVFSKVHICSCVPRRCVWQTTHFLRQLNCAVETNGGDYGRCWVSPRSSKKPPRPMVRRREISLEIFSDIFIFASNSKHKKTIKIFGKQRHVTWSYDEEPLWKSFEKNWRQTGFSRSFYPKKCNVFSVYYNS